MIDYQVVAVDDAKELIKYLKQVSSESNYLLTDFNEISINEVQEQEYIKNMLEDERSLMIVAKDEDKIVASGSIIAYKQKKKAHIGNLGVAVLKEYWNQGIGSDIVSALIGFAIETGLEIVELDVFSENEKAIALYEKFGFETIGTYSEAYKINDEYYDAYLMNLYL